MPCGESIAQHPQLTHRQIGDVHVHVDALVECLHIDSSFSRKGNGFLCVFILGSHAEGEGKESEENKDFFHSGMFF